MELNEKLKQDILSKEILIESLTEGLSKKEEIETLIQRVAAIENMLK